MNVTLFGPSRETTAKHECTCSMTMNGELKLRGAGAATKATICLTRAETIAVARLLRTCWPTTPSA